MIIGAFVGVSLYYSVNGLVVNMYEYDADQIDTPFRIIILGDLHNHDFKGRLETTIEDQKPDLIIMAGDMIDTGIHDESQIIRLVTEMRKIAPVYYMLGNHEIDYFSVNPGFVNEIEESGIVVHDKAYEDIMINDQKIRIGGMYAYPFGATDNRAATAPDDIRTFMESFAETDSFKIFIAHRPDSFVLGDVSKVYDIDIVVSAHMHGGQVIIPFLGGLYGGDLGWFPEYYHGIYKKDKIHLLITSGLGTSDKILPRFNNIPEVMVLDVR